MCFFVHLSLFTLDSFSSRLALRTSITGTGYLLRNGGDNHTSTLCLHARIYVCRRACVCMCVCVCVCVFECARACACTCVRDGGVCLFLCFAVIRHSVFFSSLLPGTIEPVFSHWLLLLLLRVLLSLSLMLLWLPFPSMCCYCFWRCFCVFAYVGKQ